MRKKKTNLRNTAQRRIVWRILEQSGRPLSAPEVHDAAQKSLPSLGIATVYREIKRLLEDQQIVTVELPGEQARYEKSGQHHHHHFKCERCDSVFDIEGCVGDITHLVPQHFTHHSHEIIIYGVCKACR